MQDQREPTVDALVERAFAAEMRRLREERGMSQTRLAKELDERYSIKIDGTAITRIERRVHDKAGARAILLGEAVAIAGILGISIDDLTSPSMARQLKEARRRLEEFESQRDRAVAEYARARGEYEALAKMVEQLDQANRDQSRRDPENRTTSVEYGRQLVRASNLWGSIKDRVPDDVSREWLIDNIDQAVRQFGIPRDALEELRALEAERRPGYAAAAAIERKVQAKREEFLHALAKNAATREELAQAAEDLNVWLSAGGDHPAAKKAMRRLMKLLDRRHVPVGNLLSWDTTEGA